MKPKDLFEPFDPPPRGLERLRARMAEAPALPSRRRRFAVAAGGALAAAAVLAVVLLWRPWRPDPFTRRLAASGEASVGLQEPVPGVSLPLEARSHTALLEVPTRREGVSFYWVVRTGPAPDPDPDG